MIKQILTKIMASVLIAEIAFSSPDIIMAQAHNVSHNTSHKRSGKSRSYDPEKDQVLNKYAAYVFGVPYKGISTQKACKRNVLASWHETDSRYLTDQASRDFYNVCLKKLKDVTENGGSTTVTFDFEKYGIKDHDTVVGIFNRVNSLLEVNHPEYLCWASGSAQLTSPGAAIENGKVVTRKDWTYSFIVDDGYRYKGDKKVLDSTVLNDIREAKKHADKVITDNASKSDYDKIKAYADYIASHNVYNSDAASDSWSGNMSPWQLLYVFDEKPETNVVCEGYAKAFQYLMDRTTFDDPTIRSKIVDGIADNGQERGRHMWNLVTIQGKNYLTDITWYDQETRTDERYLLGADDGSRNYDSDIEDLYTGDELKLSKTAYDPSTQIVKTPLNFAGTVTATGIYDSKLSSFTISSADAVTDSNDNTVSGTWKFDPSVNADQTVDKFNAEQTFKARFMPSSDADKYKALTADAALTVNKKDITVKAADAEMTAGDALPELKLVTPVTGLADTDTADGLGVILTTDTNGKTPGKYDITGTASSKWYNVTVEKGILTVKEKPKKKLTFTSVPKIKVTYGNALSDSTVTNARVTENGKTAAVTGSWSLDSSVDSTQTINKASIGKKFKVVFTPSKNADDYEPLTADAALDITKKAVTVKADDKTITEGDVLNDSDLTFKIADSSLVSGDTDADLGVKLSTKYKAGSDAGSYQITGTSSSEYYDVTVLPGTLTVNEKEKVTPVITENPVINITYGDKISENRISGGKASYNGADIPGTFTLASSVNTDEIFSAGTHTVKGMFTPNDKKSYKTVSDVDVTVNVSKKPVTVTINDIDITEGDSLPEFTMRTSPSLVGNDKASDLIDISCNAGKTPAAGTYLIIGTAKADVSNYSVTVKNGMISIKKKDTPVQPDPKPEKTKKDLMVKTAPLVTGIYGDRLSLFAVSGGQVTDSDGNAVSGRWTISDGSRIVNKSNAGNDITLTFTPDTSAYNSTTVSVKPAISRRKITVKADDISRTVGEKRTLTYKITNGTLVSGDTEADLGITLKSSDTSDTAGTYNITGSAASEWYDVTVLGGALTIKGNASGNTGSEKKTYYITYTLNGGTASGNPASFTQDTASFTLNNPARAGYTFTGWTGSNGNTPQMTVTIAKGTTGYLFYTANWTLNSSQGSGSSDSSGNAGSGSSGNSAGNSSTGNNTGNTGNTDTGSSTSAGNGSNGNSSTNGYADTDILEDTDSDADIPDIASKKGKVTKLSSGKKTVTMKYKKVSLSGYKVRYQVAIKRSTASKWNKSLTSSTKKTFKGLKKGTTYWVSVRPYVVVDNTRYFGKWAATKVRKTK